MIKVGLTGGIGSGKTTVAKIFENLGVPVYYADERAKFIMRENAAVKSKIKNLFGEQAYVDNRLNVSYISGIVFDNPKMLKKLEAIVHPAVRQDFLDWVKQQKADYVIAENAILHKTGMDKLVDYIITVTADKHEKIKRLEKRDGKTIDEIKKVMKNQNTDTQLLKKSDFVIENNENLESLIDKTVKIHSKVKNKLKKG